MLSCAPSPTLPMSVLAVEKQKYTQARAEWQRGMGSYRDRLVENAKGFVHQVEALRGTPTGFIVAAALFVFTLIMIVRAVTS